MLLMSLRNVDDSLLDLRMKLLSYFSGKFPCQSVMIFISYLPYEFI